MADYRQIHTRTWSDSWFSELDKEGKLLFLYLITNEHATVTGLYELPLRIISFEAGLDRDTVIRLLGEFQQADKAYYQDGWVLVINMQKYQASASPKIAARIKADIAKAPEGELKRMYLTRYGMDRVSLPYLEFPPNRAEQSREEQNREEKNRTEQKAQAPPNVFALYEQNIGPLTPMIAAILEDDAREYPAEWFGEAIQEALAQNKRSWKYCQAILKRWKVEGFRTQSGKTPAGAPKAVQTAQDLQNAGYTYRGS